MDETALPLSEVRLDGESIAYGHGVIVQDCRLGVWEIVLLEVSPASLSLLCGRHNVDALTPEGATLTGRAIVEGGHDGGRFVRLDGVGPLNRWPKADATRRPRRQVLRESSICPPLAS